MHFANLLFAAGLAAAAAPPAGTKFKLTVLAGNQAVNNHQVIATGAELLGGGTQVQAKCVKNKKATVATLYLNSTQLFLYTPSGQQPQQVLISNDEQFDGLALYYSPNQEIPSDAKGTGFKLGPQTSYLTFNGIKPQYCPNTGPQGGALGGQLYFTKSATPEGNSGCFNVSLRADAVSSPVACEYSGSGDA